LFNVLEERDIQIRGFSVRLPLDLCLVFSANPEDYTNRGRIVTPLKDRIGSVIRTHYPATRDLGVQIMEENAISARPAGVIVHSPRFLKEIVEEVSRLARVSPHVNQASGVSVRMSVANYENVLSNAERRGILQGLSDVVARPVDLSALAAGSRGKVELALTDESGEEDQFLIRLVEEAIKNIFDSKLSPKTFLSVIEVFNSGKKMEIGDGVRPDAFLKEVDSIKGFRKQIEALAQEWEPEIARTPAGAELQVAIAELILEGLYAHNKVNKKRKGGNSAFGS
jgi:magnesium chelatase subunit I